MSNRILSGNLYYVCWKKEISKLSSKLYKIVKNERVNASSGKAGSEVIFNKSKETIKNQSFKKELEKELK